MHRILFATLVAGSAVTPLPTYASDALASKYACVACHAAERKLVGPSWKDIATKYADGSKPAPALAASLKAGGSGKWGTVPMPPQPTVSEADALALAVWILGKK
jgi:cytochrome c